MSKFKVGDRVRCVDAGRAASLVFGTEYTVSRVMDGYDARICVKGAVSDCDWWYADRFELIQQLVEVHTGGPYVARSEYKRVCLERDDALAQAVWIRDEAVKLAAERDQLKADQESLLADLKNFEETTAALNKRVLGGNPNGWPLVPVDPLCIPEGHRAVEVTRNTGGKLVVSPKRTIFMYNREHDWPRLVVEPIPTPQSPDALPRPEFPVWIRAGWWVAMDPDSVFWVFEYEPKVDEQCGEYTSRGECVLLSDDQLTPSMRAVPVDRWRKAKWQIE